MAQTNPIHPGLGEGDLFPRPLGLIFTALHPGRVTVTSTSVPTGMSVRVLPTQYGGSPRVGTGLINVCQSPGRGLAHRAPM